MSVWIFLGVAVFVVLADFVVMRAFFRLGREADKQVDYSKIRAALMENIAHLALFDTNFSSDFLKTVPHRGIRSLRERRGHLERVVTAATRCVVYRTYIQAR